MRQRKTRRRRWRQRNEHNGSDDGRRHDGADSGDDDCVCVCVFVMVIGGSGEVRASASEKGSTEKIEQNPIWRYHLPARRHVLDTVLKHGWLSAPCLAATWRKKKVTVGMLRRHFRGQKCVRHFLGEERKFPSSPALQKLLSGPQLHFGWGHAHPGNR